MPHAISYLTRAELARKKKGWPEDNAGGGAHSEAEGDDYGVEAFGCLLRRGREAKRCEVRKAKTTSITTLVERGAMPRMADSTSHS